MTRKNLNRIRFAVAAGVISLTYSNCSPFAIGTVSSVGSNSQASLGSVTGRIPVVGDYKPIPSNFDITPYISGTIGTPTPWNPGCGPGEDGKNAPDVVGAFRFLCTASHNLYDDPIVFPGRPGASHLHTFFGNTLANASSTYESLRTTGEGSCGGGPINRSAYWMPAMMDGKGKVVMPDYTTVYYKRRPKNDPYCFKQAKNGCTNLPDGLRMIFGYNMALAPDDPQQQHVHWVCEDGTVGPDGKTEHPTIGEAACPSTTHIGAGFSAPDCWDGVHLDSPDHRSHLAYGSYGDWGYYKCPDTHPWVIPAFTMKAWYPSQGPADQATWYLSSDRMTGKPVLPNGSTFHTDWFGAWDDDIRKEWEDNAIDKFMNCSAGVLGSGRALTYPDKLNAPNPRVDPPVMTAAQKAINTQATAEMCGQTRHDELTK